MTAKTNLIVLLLFFAGGILWAQHNNPSDGFVANYMTNAKEFAALYTGKAETPYYVTFTNHPYFEQDNYVSGTICYNRVVYQNVLMRLDLYRDEITVISPDKPYRVVLNNEKFNYAVINGATIIKSDDEKKSKTKFHILLHSGTYPVVKQYNLIIREESSSLDRVVRRSFLIYQQYAILIDGKPYMVKNKNSILKLFPDRKKELNEYAKQHKLDFYKRTEQSIISMVDHYETLTNSTQKTQIYADSRR